MTLISAIPENFYKNLVNTMHIVSKILFAANKAFLATLAIVLLGSTSVFAGSIDAELQSMQKHPTSDFGDRLRLIARQAVINRDRDVLFTAVEVASNSQNHQLLGELLMEKGFYYFSLGLNPAALAEYQRAADEFSKSMATKWKSKALISIGDIYLRMNDLHAVNRSLNEASSLCKTENCIEVTAHVQRLMAHIAFIRGDIDAALSGANNALDLFTTIGDAKGESITARLLGDVFVMRGDLTAALDKFKRSEKSARRYGEPFYIGRALWGIATISYRRCEFQQALALYAEARKLFEKINYPMGLGETAEMEGEVYRFSADYKSAQERYEEAFRQYEITGSHIGMGNSNLLMGQLYFKVNDFPRAFEFYGKAYDSYSRAERKYGKTMIEFYRGDLYFKMNNTLAAEQQYILALKHFRELKNLNGTAQLLLRLGDVYLSLNKTDEAKKYFTDSYNLFVKHEDIDEQAKLLIRFARIARIEDNSETAFNYFMQAIELFERLRHQTGIDYIKNKFFENALEYYEEALQYMLVQQRYDDAFTIAESMKARSFLDLMAESATGVRDGIDHDLQSKLDELQKTIEGKKREIGLELEKDETSIVVELLRREYQTHNHQLISLESEIRNRNPKFAALKYPKPTNVKNVQRILSDDELLVEYVINGNYVDCFLIDKTKFTVMRLNVTKADLEDNVEKITSILNPENSGETPLVTDAMKRRLYKLYKDLFKSIEQKVNIKNLIIVPDGKLAKFPFEMLMSSLTPATYAISNYDIKYIQSASVLDFQRRQANTLPKQINGFIGFGDPIFDYYSYKNGLPELGDYTLGEKMTLAGSAYLRSGGKLSRLPESGIEVKEIARLFDAVGREGVVNIRDNAREESAKNITSHKYGFIHFSTHGILSSHIQALALNQYPEDIEDGILTLNEVLNRQFNSHLTVLSACETGLGTEEKGEGVTGLTRAFMYSGSRAVLASLWKVGEHQTQQLMVELYRGIINKGLSVPEALKSAKLYMINSKDALASNPFSWAPFVLYGE